MKHLKIVFSIIVVLSILLGLNASAVGLLYSAEPNTSNDAEIQWIVDSGTPGDPSATEVYLNANGSGFDIYVYKDANGAIVAQKEQKHGEDSMNYAKVDAGVDQSVIASNNSTEIYLDPVQVDDYVYNYYDENGELLATLIVDPNSTNDISEFFADAKAVNATAYSVSWTLKPGESKYGDYDLDTTGGAKYVYYKIAFGTTSTTYVGYYSSKPNTFYWMNPPFSSGLDGSFLLASSDPIRFALKNEGKVPNSYVGGYSLSPMK